MPFPVSEEFLEAAERELGRRFPEPLRSRLVGHNGGEVRDEEEDWQLHPVWDSSDKERMRRSANHVVKETRQAREWRGFPADAIAIGENGSGDRLIRDRALGSRERRVLTHFGDL